MNGTVIDLLNGSIQLAQEIAALGECSYEFPNPLIFQE